MVAVLSQNDAAERKIGDESSVTRTLPAILLDRDSSVVINTTNADDAARVARLLSQSGIEVSNIFFCEPAQILAVEAYAVVLCHRMGQTFLNTALPDGTNVSRIIVLSDCAREETAVRFLDNGARHFFSIHDSDSVLKARLEAGLRQHCGISLRSFSEGDIHFDVQRRKVTRADIPIDLSPKEYEFAHHLFSRLDQVVRNTELMTSVWSLPSDMDTRRIDTAACRVRKKLGLSQDNGWELKRVRRVGYRLSRALSRLELVG